MGEAQADQRPQPIQTDQAVTTIEILAILAFLAVVVIVHAWLAYRINRGLQQENFRLLQANLALSDKPFAFQMAQAAEDTRGKEIAAERDQTLSANGQTPFEPKRVRLQT